MNIARYKNGDNLYWNKKIKHMKGDKNMKKMFVLIPIVGIVALVGISSRNTTLIEKNHIVDASQSKYTSPVSKTIDPSTVIDTTQDYDLSTPEGRVEFMFHDIGDDEKVILTEGGGMIYGEIFQMDPITGEHYNVKNSETDPNAIVALEAKKIMLEREIEMASKEWRIWKNNKFSKCFSDNFK